MSKERKKYRTGEVRTRPDMKKGRKEQRNGEGTKGRKRTATARPMKGYIRKEGRKEQMKKQARKKDRKGKDNEINK